MSPLQEIAPIQDVPLEISVELDRHMMKISDIVALDVDSVIQLNRSAGENIDVYVGKSLVAHGEVVIIENTMGVRITNFRLSE